MKIYEVQYSDGFTGFYNDSFWLDKTKAEAKVAEENKKYTDKGIDRKPWFVIERNTKDELEQPCYGKCKKNGDSSTLCSHCRPIKPNFYDYPIICKVCGEEGGGQYRTGYDEENDKMEFMHPACMKEYLKK